MSKHTRCLDVESTDHTTSIIRRVRDVVATSTFRRGTTFKLNVIPTKNRRRVATWNRRLRDVGVPIGMGLR